jgi:hypothetical protein
MRQGNPGGGSVQRGGDFRKRRQIHVNGERADGGERAQDENDQEPVSGLGHKSGRGEKIQNRRGCNTIHGGMMTVFIRTGQAANRV